ncbi:hypothetical protein F4678DRAFT_217442 [Xylaria arbuscula]|nr:hypothetical protein F4678DRAFT_217442 [Xylaria arbuscula]
MLSFRNRTSRSSGGHSETHSFSSPAATITSLRQEPLPARVKKSSLRGRLKGITGNFTKRRAPRSYKHRMPFTPNPWHNLKPNEGLLCLIPSDAQDVETRGKSWPAIRKSFSSMASALQSNYPSVDPRSSGETSPISSSPHSKFGFSAPQRSARRWFTMATRVPPVALRHHANRVRRSSFSTVSEIASKQGDEPAPQLPKLLESSNFIDSLARTGLFRRPSEFNNPAGAVKVQNTTALNGESGACSARPFVARLPLRVKNLDMHSHKLSGYPINKRSRGSIHGINSSRTNNENKPPKQRKQRPTKEERYRTSTCSRHPVEWLDRVLETSYATRIPISPKLCVPKAIMEVLRRNKICFYVEFPRGRNVPEPLECYPGFRAALEDICDRFGDFYAPFAAYNAHTRMITLYASGSQRPENRFINADTAIFDLLLARSAWVRSTATYPSSTGTAAQSASRGTSEDLTEASDLSQASSDETLVTDPEEEETQKLGGTGKHGA